MSKIIDISAWQENVDWQAIKDSGVSGVILKLGQHFRLDSMFIDHVNNAVAVGLKYGVYYYSTACTTDIATKEANWVTEQIATYLNGQTPELGIWFDAEDDIMQATEITVTSMCLAFVDAVREAGHGLVGVYTSYNWLYSGVVDLESLEENEVPIWVAQYNYECNINSPNVFLWQFTDRYEVYDGLRVDCNETMNGWEV